MVKGWESGDKLRKSARKQPQRPLMQMHRPGIPEGLDFRFKHAERGSEYDNREIQYTLAQSMTGP